MSKESYIGGDYIETTGGDTKVYGEYISNSSLSKFVQNAGNGVLYGINGDVPIIDVIKKVIRIEITSEVTGYTIQALKGLDFKFSDPAVVVPTYKVNILDLEVDVKGQPKSIKNKGVFHVKRDAWYSLGKDKKNKYHLLNRAFIPADYSRNLYGLYWIPSYPNISARYASSGLDAFIFTRYGQRTIPAKPLRTSTKTDGSSITSPRPDPNFATDVMIHIGGTYEVFGYDHLGGSFGCFAYIPEDDIYSTAQLAEKASLDDDYDDLTSNKSWKKITNKIKKLAFEDNKDLQVILNQRDDANAYFPRKVLSE